MIVDLEKKETKGTFDLPGGGKVHLRLRSEADEAEIKAACVKNIVEYPLLDGKYQRFETEKTDYDLYFKMGYEKNIVGWDDVFDKNKIAVPVTSENKVLMMKVVPAFAEAVVKGLSVLKEQDKARSEVLEKN